MSKATFINPKVNILSDLEASVEQIPEENDTLTADLLAANLNA